MPVFSNSQTFCMADARLEISFSADSKSKDPITANAVISPNECPATISGLKSLPRVFDRINECKKIAGWANFVCFKSEADPLNITSVIEYPKISLPLLKYSCANLDFSNNSFPIPGN